MNYFLLWISNPIISLSAVQITGLIILFAGLDSDDEIAAKAGSYWDYNEPMMKHLVGNNYDQKLGVLTVTLPTILQAMNNVPFWVSYICLIFALILRFSFFRSQRVNMRVNRIIAAIKMRQANAQ